MRAFFISILLSAILSSASYACSCGEWDYDEIDEIFFGEIIDVYEASNMFEHVDDSIYVFDISKKWKGSSSNRLKVIDVYGCGHGLRGRKTNKIIVYTFKYSSFAEYLYPDFINDKVYEILSNHLNRKATTACINVNSYKYNLDSDRFFRRTFDEESAVLDSLFIEPVPLRPHYLNFTNLFFLIGVILVGIYVGKTQSKTNPYKDPEINSG